MSLKEVLSVLRHKEIAPSDWKVEGPGARFYRVMQHTREHIPDNMSCGKITFVVQADGDSATTLEGFVGSMSPDGQAMTPDGTETIIKDGAPLPEPNIDGGVAGTPVLRGFPPRLKLRGNVIVKFAYRDDDEEDNVAEYRFEGKFGEIGL